MEIHNAEERVLQWHPAFYAGIQIELAADAGNLIFENEHQLGTRPREIDVLIIKKEAGIPVSANVGRFFRKHNIVEYKSPRDYLSIDDFYKVYGYACFYKADAENTNEIRIEDLTITFVCHNMPKRLMQHWKQERNYEVSFEEAGIYYIRGDAIPIQLIVTAELSGEKNFWLRNLTHDLKETAMAKRLIAEYEKHKESGLYKAVMDIIVRANRKKFEEVKDMCEALEELMKDELDAREHIGMEKGIKQGVKAVVETLQEMGFSRQETLAKVMDKFALEEGAAEEYLGKYWS